MDFYKNKKHKNKIMPTDDEYECCVCCEKPFNHPTKRNEECCDCIYEDDGKIISLKEWSQKSAKK